MACRNALFQVEQIEQLALIAPLPAHHDPPPVVDRIRQTESRVARNHAPFFNSIGHTRPFSDVGSTSGLPLKAAVEPGAARVGVLVNPTNATTTESTLRDVAVAARATGLQIKVINASTSREIEAAFASFVRERSDVLFIASDPYYHSRRAQLVVLAARHTIPANYAQREFTEAGGLMSYGTNIADAYRQIGVYAGRILKGANPADLPVVQASKFELVINLPTARALGLEVPPTLLARADEVIE
jgi:putative ABC transport system substrate-binding protein